MTAWNDYICPWAYAARPRTEWLRAKGAEVELRFYELHPEIGPTGRPLRPGGRLDRVYDHIAEECATAGLDFTKPTRTPNSRYCLETMEVVGRDHPDALLTIDEAIARAQWVEGRALDDRRVVGSIVAEVLGRRSAARVAELVSDGQGDALLTASRNAALEVGVTATPGWRIGELTITGLHPSEQFQRWASRILGLQ